VDVVLHFSAPTVAKCNKKWGVLATGQGVVTFCNNRRQGEQGERLI
jgi:hypothetical protein